MSGKIVSILAAATMLAVSVPASAAVETRSADAIPTAHAVKAHGVRYAQDNDRRDRDGSGMRGEGGGGFHLTTGVLAALAGILAAIGIAIAVQNRSN